MAPGGAGGVQWVGPLCLLVTVIMPAVPHLLGVQGRPLGPVGIYVQSLIDTGLRAGTSHSFSSARGEGGLPRSCRGEPHPSAQPRAT